MPGQRFLRGERSRVTIVVPEDVIRGSSQAWLSVRTEAGAAVRTKPIERSNADRWRLWWGLRVDSMSSKVLSNCRS